MTMQAKPLALLLLLGACAAPGIWVEPEPGDFAFLEVFVKA
jgi:hypothetical protein